MLTLVSTLAGALGYFLVSFLGRGKGTSCCLLDFWWWGRTEHSPCRDRLSNDCFTIKHIEHFV
jgi:hypothetical protein